jgi:predicted permease
MLETTLMDVRYALRVLRQSPLFTFTAALSLAIGIGANTTIFSVVSALLLRPLPGLSAPDRLVDVGRTQDGRGFDTSSYPNYQDLRERNSTLDGIYAYRVEPEPMSLATGGDAERVYGAIVTANYFSVLGVRPAIGRLLQDSDDRSDAAHAVVVLSYDIWTRKFEANPGIAGQTIAINGHPFMVAGVAPAGFQGTTILKADVWVPMSTLSASVPRINPDIFKQRASVWLAMGGRLKNGVSVRQADAEARTIGAALAQEHPEENRGKNFTVLTSALVPGQVSAVAGFMGLLMGIVGLVLLIACVNVAGMLLARGVVRRREIAVRVAIGAGRPRLVRQLLTETAILIIVAGTIAVLLTKWLTALLLALLPSIPVPLALDISMDWRVAAFATTLSLTAALLSGLAPALHASRSDLVPALKTEGLDSSSTSRLRLRNVFLIGQVAMSMLLVVVAGLFLRALEHAAHIGTGFDERQVEVVQLDLSLGGYKAATGQPFLRDLLERTRALPRVESATVTVDLPLDGGRMGFGGVRVPGKTPPRGDSFQADWNVVEPGFFRTLKLPLLRGRDFTDSDTSASQPVAIVNEAFTRMIWPGEDALGKRIVVAGNDGPITVAIVGIASDARLIWLTGNVEPYIYVPFAQRYSSRVALLVRARDGQSAIPVVRQLLRSMNPNLPVTEAMPLSSVTAIGLIPQRIAASVAGSLGIVGLLLAAIGIYGVTAYAVSRRTREIGIRMALGADSRAVMRLILRQGIVLAGIGVAIGVGIAAVGSKLLESLLFGVRGLDPVTFGGACALFALVTLIATYVPAHRAASVDPMIALRTE